MVCLFNAWSVWKNEKIHFHVLNTSWLCLCIILNFQVWEWHINITVPLARTPKATLKCCHAQDIYVGTVFIHKLLTQQHQPPEIEINPPKMTDGCPNGRVLRSAHAHYVPFSPCEMHFSMYSEFPWREAGDVWCFPPLSWLSGLSLDSPFLSPLLFFCLVLLTLAA